MSDHRDDQRDLNYIKAETFRGHHKEQTGILLDRSERMDSEKKALLRMVLDRGASYNQLARLSGEHATTVSRRFRAMVRRLRGRPPQAADTSLRLLTPLEKTILIESFLYGSGQREIAAKLGISRYRVRKVLRPFQDPKRSGASHPI